MVDEFGRVAVRSSQLNRLIYLLIQMFWICSCCSVINDIVTWRWVYILIFSDTWLCNSITANECPLASLIFNTIYVFGSAQGVINTRSLHEWGNWRIVSFVGARIYKIYSSFLWVFSILAYENITLKHLVLNNVGAGQYLDGWPPDVGSWICCWD